MSMSKDETRQVVERWLEEIFNKHRLDAVDELLAEDFKRYDGHSWTYGRENYKRLLSSFFHALPDVKHTATHIAIDGDLVMMRWEATGTFTGDFLAPDGSVAFPATNQPVAFTGTDTVVLRDGLVTETYSSADKLALFGQLVPTIGATVMQEFSKLAPSSN